MRVPAGPGNPLEPLGPLRKSAAASHARTPTGTRALGRLSGPRPRRTPSVLSGIPQTTSEGGGEEEGGAARGAALRSEEAPPAGLPELRAPGRDRAARSTTAGARVSALAKKKKKLQRKETQGQQAHPYPASWGKTEANLGQNTKHSTRFGCNIYFSL